MRILRSVVVVCALVAVPFGVRTLTGIGSTLKAAANGRHLAKAPAVGTAPQALQDTKMSRAEREELIDLLQKSESEFLQAIDGLSDQQWAYKPAPDKWSVGEVVEHIVLADALLFETAIKSVEGQPDANWDATVSKTDILRKALPNRSRRVDAPAAIKPQKGMTRAALQSRFKEQRAQALAYARQTDKPLKAHTAANPFFGSLNAHQWLLYIPLHHLRHNQQIAEVKASEGYPRHRETPIGIEEVKGK